MHTSGVKCTEFEVIILQYYCRTLAAMTNKTNFSLVIQQQSDSADLWIQMTSKISWALAYPKIPSFSFPLKWHWGPATKASSNTHSPGVCA